MIKGATYEGVEYLPQNFLVKSGSGSLRELLRPWNHAKIIKVKRKYCVVYVWNTDKVLLKSKRCDLLVLSLKDFDNYFRQVFNLVSIGELRNPIRCKDDILAWPLEKLGCSQRILNALRNKCYQTEDHSLDFIRTVGQLIEMTEYELSKYPELGKKSITEIKDYLAFHDLYLSCTEGEQ